MAVVNAVSRTMHLPFRPTIDEDSQHAVVDLHGVRHVFATAVPRSGTTLYAQARDALETIRRINERERTQASILSQTVFLSDPIFREPCRQLLREFYGDEMPATTFVPQHPCCGKLLAIEAHGAGNGRDGLQIRRRSERVVAAEHDGVTWTLVAGVEPDSDAQSTHDRVLSAFRSMEASLNEAGVAFDRVFRTWLYLGDIVGPEADTQRYKELNRARSTFFDGIRFSADRVPPGFQGIAFPASTGIGADDRNIVMSCLAITSTRDDLRVVPMENPLQVPAFHYAARYSPQSPKFSRAVAIVNGRRAGIFISGTAGITQSESRFLDDAAAQTRQTLDNIAALIDEANFQRHGIEGHGASLADLAQVRVYIKRPADYPTIRAVCESRLRNVPIIYVAADVCRPELLVEIEGIAFSQRPE